MSTIRCLIVDDERLARVALRTLLAQFPHVDIVGEAASAQDAIRLAEAQHPDLVFLDIEMPQMSGIEVAGKLGPQPFIVFLTAHEQYALPAFDVNAMDYLLKPVSNERMARTLERFASLSPGYSPSEPLLKIGLSGLRWPASELLMIKASGNYTVATRANGQSAVVRQTLADWEKQLPQDQFVRIDRGTLLNYDAIRGVEYRHRSVRVQLGPDLAFTFGGRAAHRLRSFRT